MTTGSRFPIYSFTGRNQALELLKKAEELKYLLFEFGVYGTDDLSLGELEEDLSKELLKFEKGKL